MRLVRSPYQYGKSQTATPISPRMERIEIQITRRRKNCPIVRISSLIRTTIADQTVAANRLVEES